MIDASASHLVRVSLATLLTMVAAGHCLSSRSVADEPKAPATARSREAIARVAGGYRLFLGADRIPLKMQQEPVLRWPNPTRKTPEGATFVWTLDGRPEAIGCVWDRGVLSHAFHSLSRSPLVAEYNGQTIWRPEKAGLEFATMANAPEPADSAVKRLAQMRELARRFACRIAGERVREELRLLPRPLYRYQTERSKLIDGALFAFVQGTDPEVVLVLEAVPRDARSEWQYALTRRSAAPLEADLDGKRIWAVPSSAGGFVEAWFHGDIASAK
jgi:hypothetical protein